MLKNSKLTAETTTDNIASGERGTNIFAENTPAFFVGGTTSIIIVFILVVTIITVVYSSIKTFS